ncbi:hypothetical protein B9Z55_004893 [Caenorhabditis nigoni]|uniref:Zer-1-like leucine-rich repeats region domain-containing protein n=1 Tax=Caenorhabditis nigoni TaxID=1611254 RepID=A0A2G5UZ70_9PELO|nr:hypothetical protein B9Z55_004893 [Caenorhabditis nigoni]
MQIKHKEFNERFQFSNLCDMFPNLCYLDISSAKGLSTLNGIKHLKNLRKLVMSDVKLRDIDGYKELSELKNLKVLDVSGEGRFYISDPLVTIPVIRHLLTAEVRMESLEFLDCSMTSVQEHELREFVEHHPKLKTAVAISTACDNLSIPTIDLLNFISPTSFAKCLKYAITNERNNSAQMCIKGISKKLDRIHDRLDDTEISKFINALCYASRESKDQKTKYWAIKCFHESIFFQTERFFSSFSLEIPRIVESISISYDNLKQFCTHARHCLWSIFNRILGFFRFGSTLQERLFNLTVEKTLKLLCQRPRNDGGGTQILQTPGRFISVDLYTAMCNDTKVIKWLFAFANKLARWESSFYQRIIELIVSLMKEASEKTLKLLVSNGQIVENCVEQIMIISDLPTKDTQKHLLHFLLVFAPVMSDEQLENCYGGETVTRLMGVINTKEFRNPFEETRALLLCSILSLLLAKNLTNHREYINMKIKEFGNGWGQLNIPGCHEMSGKVMNALVNSIHSTDDSICCCLILLSTFIYTEGYEADGFWNFMKTTSEGIRDNQSMAEYARNAAEAVLYEMGRIEKKYKI